MKFKFIKLFLLLVLVFVSGWLIWVYAIPFYVGRDGCISEYKAIHIASEDISKSHGDVSKYKIKTRRINDDWEIYFKLKVPSYGGTAAYRINARTGKIDSAIFTQ